jgi:hypothetical protein
VIGPLLSLALAALPAPHQAASAAEPQSQPARVAWRDAMIRRDTARQIADDLPKTPERFRFECGFVQYSPKAIVRQRLCVLEGERPITDPRRLADRARREAARPDVTAADRLRRIAWMRAMLLHTPEDQGAPFKTFMIEESVAASDLDGGPVSTSEVDAISIPYYGRPPVEYPPSAIRAGAHGRIQLRCAVIEGGRLHCETLTPYFTGPLAAADGSVASPALLPLVAETHRAAHRARIAPVTRDGRQTRGMGFVFTIDFRLPD